METDLDDLIFVRLYCNKCENQECKTRPIGRWINVDAEELGCTKGVSEDLAAKYWHLIDETLPFLAANKNQEYKREIYKETEDVLKNIYAGQAGCLYDEKGKALNRKPR